MYGVFELKLSDRLRWFSLSPRPIPVWNGDKPRSGCLAYTVTTIPPGVTINYLTHAALPLLQQALAPTLDGRLLHGGLGVPMGGVSEGSSQQTNVMKLHTTSLFQLHHGLCSTRIAQ